MIATIFAFTLSVVTGGILAFLAIKSQEDSLNEVPAEVANPFAVFSVALAFDPDYSIIWDTQVPALQLIGPEGIRAWQLHWFYSRSARIYPELYDGSTFASWLDFLEKEHLIDRAGARVFITVEGREFLRYRVIPKTVLAA